MHFRWVDCVDSFGSGKLSLSQILQPAIDLARHGFPVAGPITAHLWQEGCDPLMQENNKFGKDLLIKGWLLRELGFYSQISLLCHSRYYAILAQSRRVA